MYHGGLGERLAVEIRCIMLHDAHDDPDRPRMPLQYERFKSRHIERRVSNASPRQKRTHAPMASYAPQISSRRTFAIISHPDAGKTTLTEKLLLYTGQVQLSLIHI